MLLDLRLVRVLLGSFLQGSDSVRDLAALELSPAQRVRDRRIVRSKLTRLADHRLCVLDILTALKLGIAHEVEQQRLLGRDFERLAQGCTRLWPTLPFFERARLQEQ